MKKALLAVALAASVAACTDYPVAQRALEAYGFTDIELLGHG
jgi:hypothetical protein